MSDLQQFTDRIRRFARARRHLLDAALLYRVGFLALIAATVGLCLLSGGPWRVVGARPPQTLPLAWVNLALFLVLALCWLILLGMLCLRWSRRRPPLAEAFRMEQLAGGLNSRLVSAWDFLTHGPDTPLTRAVVGKARDDLDFDFEARLDRTERNLRRQRFAVVALLFLVLALTPWFGVLAVYANLSSSLFAVREALFPIEFHVEPGPGQHVYLIDRQPPEEAHVGVRFPGREYSTVKLVQQVGNETKTIDLNVDGNGEAAATLGSDVEADHAVHFEFGTQQSENMTLTFTRLPKLVNMQTDLVYPSYTRLPPRSLEGPQPRLLALPGTRMVIGFAFSKDIDEAGIDWGDGNPPQRLDVTGRFATVELVQAPTPRKALLQVRDRHGFALPTPVGIDFAVQEDEKPQVLLPRHLKEDMPLLEEQAKAFSFGVQATDDFGVSRVVLKWRKGSVDNPAARPLEGEEPPHDFSPAQPKVPVNFDKVFEKLALKPGDKVTFWVEAYDNREPSKQMTASRRCSLFVFQDALGGLTIKELGFGNDSEMGRERIPKATRATAVKAPEGLQTREGVKNEEKSNLVTGTQAPTVRGEFGQATRDYFRLLSNVKYPDETPEKK